MPSAYSSTQPDNSPPDSAIHSVLVSIVIPMRNEERFIGKCLDSILASDFPSDAFEIMVVDGCSTDNSREVVERKASVNPTIRVLDNPNRSTPIGLNIGIRQARGRYLIRMDAHAEYPPDYIGNCVSELERTGAANVGGTLITKPGADTLIARGIALMTQTKTGVGNSAYRIGASARFVDTVPFGTFRRSLFCEIGLFREDLDRSQDYELNARIRYSGRRVYLSSIIQSTYYNAPTLGRFVRQAWRNGIWVGRTWLRYPMSFCCRHAAPVGLLTVVLFPLMLSWVYPPCGWVSAFAIAMYLLMISATGLRVSIAEDWRMLVLVPSLMALYHFTYGVATVAGLLSSQRSKYACSPPCMLEESSGFERGAVA